MEQKWEAVSQGCLENYQLPVEWRTVRDRVKSASASGGSESCDERQQLVVEIRALREAEPIAKSLEKEDEEKLDAMGREMRQAAMESIEERGSLDKPSKERKSLPEIMEAIMEKKISIMAEAQRIKDEKEHSLALIRLEKEHALEERRIALEERRLALEERRLALEEEYFKRGLRK